MIQFPPFEPDRSSFATGASPLVINCAPVADGWGPLPQFVALSSALASAPKGAIAVRTSSGSYRIFAATTTGLYELNTANWTWTDVSRLAGGAYACPPTDNWSMAPFGSYLIATQIADDPQYIDINSGTNFAALPGSPPRAKYVGSAGGFVILANLTGNPTGLRTSGIDDAGFWTVGLRLSGDQTLPDGEDISGLFSGETGCLIFQKKKIRQLSVTADTNYPFAISPVNASRGVIAPLSITGIGPDLFGYLSADGFCIGVEGRSIGTERVDRWFFSTIDQAQVQDVRGGTDPYKKHFLWQATKADGTRFTVGYNWAQDRWFYSDLNSSHLVDLVTPSVTWDGASALFASWDAATVAWDSRVLIGGAPTFAGFDSSYRLGFFTGTPMAATLYTAQMQFAPGRRSYVRGARLIGDTQSHTITFGAAAKHGDSITFGSAVSPNTIGACNKRIDGLLHQFKVDIAAGVSWNHLDGIEPDFVPSGVR